LQYAATLFPTTKIIWSQILPRSNWRYSENLKAMDRVRIRLNNAAATGGGAAPIITAGPNQSN
jgi:hypothetical protein